jgi:GST-like protein
MELGEYPNVKRWFEQIAARPATQTAYAKGEAVRNA